MADSLLSLIEELLDPDVADIHPSGIERSPGAYHVDFVDWENRARAAVAQAKAAPDAVAREREACAAVCDALAADVPKDDTDRDALEGCAAAIRART